MNSSDLELLQRPLRFNPIGRDYVWGGSRLKQKYGHLVEGNHLAEVWLLSGHAAGMTTVAGGPLEGLTLPQLLRRFGTQLVGSNCGPDFPLLFKLLDVEEWLSVQVHPTSEKAPTGESFGKTEFWLTLRANSNAQLLLGLKAGITRAEITTAGATAALISLLRRENMEVGQAFFVPAGTIHALGPGPTVLEIQESSDTTYRMYDWDRPQDPARPRPIHWREALDVLVTEGSGPGPVQPQKATWQRHVGEKLAGTKTFEVLRLALAPPARLKGSTSMHSMEVLVGLKGSAHIEVDSSTELVSAWDCILLPAAMGSFTIQPATNFEFVAVRLPAGAETPHFW